MSYLEKEIPHDAKIGQKKFSKTYFANCTCFPFLNHVIFAVGKAVT